MKGFRARPAGFVARIGAAEAAVLADVVGQVAELLLEAADGADDEASEESTGHGTFRLTPVTPPADPAVRRLLPDASLDDVDVAAEFRRLTHEDLRQVKTERAQAFADALAGLGETGRLVVRREEAPQVAAVLTDVRLVLADRLGLETDEDSVVLDHVVQGPPPVEPHELATYHLGSVFAVLGYLQETLVVAMTEELEAGAAEE